MKTITFLLLYVLVFLMVLQYTKSYSTYGAPSEFGNNTTTTCTVGGDPGIVNCTGPAIFKNLTGTGAGNCSETGACAPSLAYMNFTNKGNFTVNTSNGEIVNLSNFFLVNSTQARIHPVNPGSWYSAALWLHTGLQSGIYAETTTGTALRGEASSDGTAIWAHTGGSNGWAGYFYGGLGVRILDDLYVGATSGNTIPMTGDDVFISDDAEVGDNLTVGGDTYLAGNETIDGYLHLGGAIHNQSTERGDLFTYGHIFSNASITSTARKFGISLLSLNHGTVANITSTGETAFMEVNDELICDSTKPFIPGKAPAGHQGFFFTILNSSPVDYRGATGEIIGVFNSSCIKVSIAASGLRELDNSTTLSYYIYKSPTLAVTDRGSLFFHVGKNPDAKFKIYIPEGRGFHGVYVDDTAGADQHQSLTVDTDANNKTGVVSINSFIRSTIPVIAKDLISVLIEAVLSNFNKGSYVALDINLIAQTDSGQTGYGLNMTHSDAIRIRGNFTHLIHYGEEANLSMAWYDNTTVTQKALGNFTSTTDDMEIFQKQDSVIYIGNNLNFTTISLVFNTTSSGDIQIEFYYVNGTGHWRNFTAYVDSTNGGRQSGTISFTNPTDRGKGHTDLVGTNFPDTTDYYYVAIKRTKKTIATSPIENTITISGGGETMILQKDMLKLKPVTAPPELCTAEIESGMYYDDDINQYCFCTGSDWTQMDGGGTTGCS